MSVIESFSNSVKSWSFFPIWKMAGPQTRVLHCSVIIGRNPTEANATSSVISYTWKCISPYLKIL